MRSSATSSPEPRWFKRVTATPWRVASSLVLFTVATRLPVLLYPKACDDEQVYVVVAREMLFGGRPYIDALERKPPLLFYLYEAILRLFGDSNYFALHVAALLWTLATMALLYWIARRLFNPAAGFAAALAYSLFMTWANRASLALNGELMMNLPIVAATAIVLAQPRSRARPGLVVAGALVAIGFLIKQPAAAAGLPLAIYLLHPDYRRRSGLRWAHSIVQCALLASGFALVLAVAGLLLFRAGLLREAWYWTIVDQAPAFGPTTWFFWHRLPWRGFLFLSETLPLLLCAAISIRSARKPDGPWHDRRAELDLLLVLLAVLVVGVTANGQFAYHYFLQLMPPLALLAAPVLGGIWQGALVMRHSPLQPGFLRGWMTALALFFLVVNAVGLALIRAPLATAVYVRAHSSESDRIFMWGQGTRQTGIYLDARRRPASRYIASFPLTGFIWGLLDPDYDTSRRIRPGAWDNLRADFARHPPAFIVDTHAVADPRFCAIRNYPYLRDLLDRDFREVFRAADGIVYQRLPRH